MIQYFGYATPELEGQEAPLSRLWTLIKFIYRAIEIAIVMGIVSFIVIILFDL